jgi:hypothetical protein
MMSLEKQSNSLGVAMSKVAILIAPMAMLLHAPAAAASIQVTSTSEDTVGQSIVYNLRNKIAASSLHKVAYTRDTAGFVIVIVTLKDNNGRTSIYSASLLMPPFDKKGYDYFITSAVGTCGADVTEACAASILSTFDDEITEIVSAFTEAFKRNK